MSYLFFVDPSNNIILHPDCLKLCEELRVLDEKEAAAIVYAYDYNGPYKQFAERDRKRKALIKVYGSDDKDIFEKDKIQNAVDAYMSLQYNPKIELDRVYDQKIDGLQSELVSAKDEKDIARILKSIEMLRKSKRELQAEVYDEILKEGRVVGNASLSFLEKLQRNKDAYKNIMKKKK
jgi:hypothetical protein